jgi:hypothetical protein
VAEDLQHLLNLVVASVERRNLVLPSQQIQIGRKILEKRRQLKPLAQTLFSQFVVPDSGRDS